MFDDIVHIGYLVDDLDKAVAWFGHTFGAVNAGGGTMARGPIVASGGRNAFVRFGWVEAELMEPADKSGLPQNTLVMHHVGYVVADIPQAVARAKAKGFRFLADAPNTNVMGQQVLYFDPATTGGLMMHLTKVPPRAVAAQAGDHVRIDAIVHAGYRVRDAEAATAWYVDKFDGVLIGGGPSRRGRRNAFVNFGRVQVELIEPHDTSALAADQVLDHVGYVTPDINAGMAACARRGIRFEAQAANTNAVGQQVLYFDATTSMGARMHLTQLPA